MATTVTAAITLLSALLGLAYSLRAVARGPATALSLIHISTSTFPWTWCP